MKNIYEKQNSESFLKLLAAQRHMYNKAKKIKSNRTFFSLLLIIAGFACSIWYNKWSPYLSMLAGVWTFVLFLFKNYEKNIITQGAKIQEEFDTSLFEIPWNGLLVGNKITREIIADANSSFKGDRSSLLNWYANYNKDSHIQNVIMCQRANLSWDWRLRQAYSNFLMFLVLLLFFGEVVYALIQHYSLYGYLIELLIPSIPIISIGIDSIVDNKALAKEKQAKELEVTSILERGHMDLETARRIQDIIYSFRVSPALIPEYFYNRLWERYNNNMHESVD